MPIAFGDTPITSVSRGANAIASAALERLGFPGQTASVFSAISPPDAPTNLTITVEEDYAAPSQVTGLAVDSTGDGTIDLSWTAPASDAAISDYSVEYTPSGGSAATVLVGASTTSYQLTGLTNDTEYSIRVAAVSAGGTGAYSAAVTGTPGVAPPALTINYKYTTSRSNSTGIGYQVNEDGNRLGGATRIKVTVVSSSSGSGESIYPIFGTSNVSLTNPEPGGTLSLTNGAVISWQGNGSLLGGRNVYGELSIAKTSSSADSTVYYATIRLTLLDDSGTIIAASNDIDVAWSRNDGD